LRRCQVFYNDEHPRTLDVRQVKVKTSPGRRYYQLPNFGYDHELRQRDKPTGRFNN